jgi:putative transposase
MTSPSPLLFGEYYHIFNRGNNREDIFLEERNYVHFLRLYEKYILPAAETYAFCLLKNHFHFLVKVKTEDEILKNLNTLKTETEQTLKTETKQTLKVVKTFRVGDLPPDYPSRSFSNFFNAYSKAINKEYGRVGALFQHPFGRVLIKDEPHLINVIAYIHKNPQKHHFVADYRTGNTRPILTWLAMKPRLFVDKRCSIVLAGGMHSSNYRTNGLRMQQCVGYRIKMIDYWKKRP